MFHILLLLIPTVFKRKMESHFTTLYKGAELDQSSFQSIGLIPGFSSLDNYISPQSNKMRFLSQSVLTLTIFDHSEFV